MKPINTDKSIALLFCALTMLFVIMSMKNQTFFNWVFDRHHNQCSWYIRPVVLMATGKILWSIQNAGDAGKSIVTPAIFGLLMCIGLIFYGFKKLEKKKTSKR